MVRYADDTGSASDESVVLPDASTLFRHPAVHRRRHDNDAVASAVRLEHFVRTIGLRWRCDIGYVIFR